MPRTNSTDPITSFNGRFRFLSNFAPAKVELDGVEYPTVEHAFQAAKSLDNKDRKKIREAPTPGKAKRLGRKVKLRSDWERIKIPLMYDLLYKKFVQPDFKRALLNTGDRQLIEGNSWGDRFWGESPVGNGSNHLGKLLMQLREQLVGAS